MSTVLVIDGMVLAYRQFHAVGHLSNSKKEPTGLRFGVLRAIMSYQKKFKAEHVVVVWDMPGKILKAEGHAEYKANRVTTPEQQNMYDQLPQLRGTLANTKWEQVFKPGYEADDLIAAVVEEEVRHGNDVVIITTDTDLYQLLWNGVRLWTGKSGDGVTDRHDVKKSWGIWPEQMPVLRAVVGDKSDNLAALGNKVQVAAVQQFLQTHPEVKSVGELPVAMGQKDPLTFTATEMAWWRDVEEREKLMRPLLPDDGLASCTVQGARNMTGLLQEFMQMESSSLAVRVGEMV